jgi:phosphatidylglycerophosphate synthase
LLWVKHFSPLSITLAGGISGVLAALALAWHFPLLATILLLTSGYLDTLDGTVARATGRTSDLGCVLDILSDRMVECAMIIALFSLAPYQRGWLSLWMLGACYLCVTSFLVVGIVTPNRSEKGFHYSPGLMERAEAFIFFILMIWLPSIFAWLAGLFSLLVILTSYLRVREFVSQYSRS